MHETLIKHEKGLDKKFDDEVIAQAKQHYHPSKLKIKDQAIDY